LDLEGTKGSGSYSIEQGRQNKKTHGHRFKGRIRDLEIIYIASSGGGVGVKKQMGVAFPGLQGKRRVQVSARSAEIAWN